MNTSHTAQNNLETWIKQASECMEAGNYDDARKWCKKVLAKQPEATHAIFLLGSTELLTGNIPRAIQLLRRAQQLDPNSAATAQNFAIALRKSGDDLSAIKAFERLAEINPATTATYEALRYLYIRTQTCDAGIAFLKSVHQKAPQVTDVLIHISALHREIGALSDAIMYGERARAIDPYGGKAMFHLAAAYLKQKQYSAGISLFGTAAMAHSTDSAYLKKFALEMQADATMVQQIGNALNAALQPSKDHQIMRDAWEEVAVETLKAQLQFFTVNKTNIVFFHVDWEGAHPFLKKAEAIDYTGTLIAACRLARRAYPNAFICVLTDKASDLSRLPTDVQILRIDANPKHMMFSRMRAYRALIMTEKLQGPTLFLDTDLCLNKDFTPIFDGSFDIALTYRTDPGLWHMPVNEGMILATDGASPATMQFFGEGLDIYEWLSDHEAVKQRYEFSIKMWRGGQLSLGVMVNHDTPPDTPQDRNIRGLRYRFLSCDFYNYPAQITDTFAFLSAKWAVHFKGGSGKNMIETYIAQLGTYPL